MGKSTLSSKREQISQEAPACFVVEIAKLFFRLNYGFVTFAYKVDAYDAVENGNNDPDLPKYDLSFGGRRLFCRQRYSDLGKLFSREKTPSVEVQKGR